MRILTITSDTYVSITALMIQSLRVWHPRIPVVVYALETGWTASHSDQLAALGVTVRIVPEPDMRHRAGAMGSAVFCVWKLSVLMEQTEPYLLLDSDTLILRPLDELLAMIERDGWMTVNEGTRLGRYFEGDITRLMPMSEAQREWPGFNTGVLGCHPDLHRDVVALAHKWSEQIGGIFLGDQGLLNLAWCHLRPAMPPSADVQFNGGWSRDHRVNLRQTIVHLAGFEGLFSPADKLAHQQALWSAWPRGVRLVNLTDTCFWREHLPRHPWPWLNQCDRPVHRAFVRQMRQASRALAGTPWLLVENGYQAYLVDRELLAQVDAFWAREGHAFARVRHKPTFHLNGAGGATPAWWRRIVRWRMAMRARLPH